MGSDPKLHSLLCVIISDRSLLKIRLTLGSVALAADGAVAASDG